MDKLINEINRWKVKKDTIVDTEIRKNITPIKITTPILLYTEYTCPFFTYFFITGKPYLFNPKFVKPVRDSVIIKYYLDAENIIVNPDIKIYDSKTLAAYLKLIDKNIKIPQKIYTFDNLYVLGEQIEDSGISLDIKTIHQIQKNIINQNIKTETSIYEHILSNNISSRYFYFCDEKQCPYQHFCKYKNKL